MDKIIDTLLDSMTDEFYFQDVNRWAKRLRIEDYSQDSAFRHIFKSRQEFRSVIKYRVNIFQEKKTVTMFNQLLNPIGYAFVPNLYLECKDIGPGLYIEHGFSSIIFAKKIGHNFHFNQTVTIGAGKGGIPVIGDNCSVYCNSVVIGGVKLGNNVKVGAGTVVFEDVPSDSTVVSAAPRVIRH